MEQNLSQSLFISFKHAIMYINYVIVWGLFHLYWNFKCTKQLTKKNVFGWLDFCIRQTYCDYNKVLLVLNVKYFRIDCWVISWLTNIIISNIKRNWVFMIMNASLILFYWEKIIPDDKFVNLGNSYNLYWFKLL